jgi:hypothetical protein
MYGMVFKWFKQAGGLKWQPFEKPNKLSGFQIIEVF